MKRLCVVLAVLAPTLTIVLTAVAAPGPQAAKTNAVTLVCKNENKRADLIPQITVDLNEAEGRVTVFYPATSLAYPGKVIETPAITAGPLAATFDSKMIAFDVLDRYNRGFYQRYTLDRLSGVLLDFTSVNGPYDQAPPSDRGIRRYNCKVGKTKF